MVTLVCEGACNPGTAEWKRWRDGVYRRIVASAGALGWPAAVLRRWVHTPHRATDRRHRYACTVCGARRTWGS